MKDRFPVDTGGNAVQSWKHPIVVRSADKKLYLYLPKNAARIPNRNWIRSGSGTGKSIRMPKLQPRDHPAWAIANQHFELVVNSVSRIFSHTDVFMQFNISERCSSSCQSARGLDCVCWSPAVGHGRTERPKNTVCGRFDVETGPAGGWQKNDMRPVWLLAGPSEGADLEWSIAFVEVSGPDFDPRWMSAHEERAAPIAG